MSENWAAHYFATGVTILYSYIITALNLIMLQEAFAVYLKFKYAHYSSKQE